MGQAPNTFLCTDRDYGDFVLEYEYFPHPTLNCGVQFRSQIREEGDRVWGYQCEIDPSDRKWSAGVFHEAGRGWLYPVEHAAAQAAFKPGEWNAVRIVCLGPVIQTYLNGVPVAELLDDGARKALLNNGRSLLAAGITDIEGKFRMGDSVMITDAAGQNIARGLVNYSNDDPVHQG